METITSNKATKANKDHTCDFCFEPIPKGMEYLKSTHKVDGRIYDFKSHKDCEYIAQKMNMYDDYYDEGLTGDAFQDIINDEYYCLMTADIPKTEKSWLEQIKSDCRATEFKAKLEFVVAYYKLK